MKKLNSITILLLFALALFSLMAFTSIKKAISPSIKLDPQPIIEIPVASLKVDSIDELKQWMKK